MRKVLPAMRPHVYPSRRGAVGRRTAGHHHPPSTEPPDTVFCGRIRGGRAPRSARPRPLGSSSSRKSDLIGIHRVPASTRKQIKTTKSVCVFFCIYFWFKLVASRHFILVVSNSNFISPPRARHAQCGYRRARATCTSWLSSRARDTRKSR